jgi:flavin reductase (DIM6/NTAB) family NADH-FMN oxidoreductase RutF
VLDSGRFRAVLGRFATGVTVMTSVADGRPHGMTANAVASVSLDPPLVLVCVDRSAVMAEVVAAGGVFALSVLDRAQRPWSDRFAEPGRPPGDEQFDGVPTIRRTTGAPVLDGAVAWLDCQVWASYDGGDHVIVVGEVVDLDVGEADDPLLYFRSGYGRYVADGT